MISHNKLLRVNLTTEKVNIETIDESILRRYFGGGALASYYLLRELKPGVDPLSAENVLVFAGSVLTGTQVPGASRFTIASKSPLTNGFAESEAGGWWAPQFSKAGFIAAIITGKASRPVYIWIKDGQVEIRDAAHLKDKTTGEAEKLVREELGDNRIVFAQTGPGGEKLVRYACVLNNVKHANGRTGIGAVFGSKNLRGVAVRGTQEVEVHDKEKLKELIKWFADNWQDNPVNSRLNKYGTTHNLWSLQQTGTLPSYNWQESYFDGADKFTGEKMAETILLKNEGCYACPVRCKRVVQDEKYGVDPYYGGPEYETIGGFGSICGNDDLPAIAKAHELCNKYGIDTISTSVAIGFAMECYEKGILTTEDTGGLKLEWGNVDVIFKLIEMIAKREGIGYILGEGIARAAKEFGGGAEKFAMHIKGQEFPAHDPRGKTGVALGFAVSPTGADHLEMPHDIGFADYTGALENIQVLGLYDPVDTIDLTAKKLRLFHRLQLMTCFGNCSGLCYLVVAPAFTFTYEKIEEIVKAVTGWRVSIYEFSKIGERANVMARMFNVREGFTAEDDNMPERMYEPIGNGPLKGEYLDREQFRRFIDEYYVYSGWDENGVPSPAKLAELELEWINQGGF